MSRKKFTLFVIMAMLSGTFVCISMLIAFFIGEKFFFDKLFYRKSPIFGYYQKGNYWLLPKKDESILVKIRAQDVQKLVDGASQGKSLFKQEQKVFTVAVLGDSFG